MTACSQAQAADSKSDKTGGCDVERNGLSLSFSMFRMKPILVGKTKMGFDWHPLNATLHNI